MVDMAMKVGAKGSILQVPCLGCCWKVMPVTELEVRRLRPGWRGMAGREGMSSSLDVMGRSAHGLGCLPTRGR